MSGSRLFFILFFLISFCQKSIGSTVLKAWYSERTNEVKLIWEKSDNTFRQYVLQHSIDEKNWKEIAQQMVTDFYTRQVFQFFHKSPARGKNYYRLKMVNGTGNAILSSPIMIKAETSGYGWAIYPVPVGDLLTLEYKGNQKIMGIINIFIIGINGYIHKRLRYASLNNVIRIPVSNLGKGIYEVRIVILDEMTWSQRFVK